MAARRMIIGVAIWDTRYSAEGISDTLGDMTAHWTRFSVDDLLSQIHTETGMYPPLFVSTSVNDLLRSAADAKIDQLVIVPSGVVVNDSTMFCAGLASVRHADLSYDLKCNAQAGHVRLKENLMVLGGNLLQVIAEAGVSECQGELAVDRFLREYVNPTVAMLPMEMSKAVSFTHHLDDPVMFEHCYHTPIDQLPDGYSDQLGFIRRWKQEGDLSGVFWAYNTDGDRLAVGCDADCFVTVASGLLPFYTIYNMGMLPGSKVVFVDINHNCLDFQRYLLDEITSGIGSYHDVVRTFSLERGLTPVGWSENIQADFDAMLDDIRGKKWLLADISFEFVHGDIVDLPPTIREDIRLARSPMIWFSNVFRYMPTISKRYDSDQFRAYISGLLHLNPSCRWLGVDPRNQQCRSPLNQIGEPEYIPCIGLEHIPIESWLMDLGVSGPATIAQMHHMRSGEASGIIGDEPGRRIPRVMIGISPSHGCRMHTWDDRWRYGGSIELSGIQLISSNPGDTHCVINHGEDSCCIIEMLVG